MSLSIKKQTLENVTNSLAQYLPDGFLWESKCIDGTNLRALLKGLSGVLLDAECFLKIYSSEFIPLNTIVFIEDWERALAIPDGCFLAMGTNEERRMDILIKLAGMGVQTENDFLVLATTLGVDITIERGAELSPFPITFPIVFFQDPQEAFFTIVVTFNATTGGFFTYNFAFPFGDVQKHKLECLFRKIIPANYKIVFRSI